MIAAVFLDRDGVLNRAVVRNGMPYPPNSVEDMEILPGVPEACHALKSAGFLLIVITNQPDVARGTQTRQAVEEINAAIRSRVQVDDFLVCYHTDSDHCSCRKPRPGLIHEAALRWAIDLPRSFVVGDRCRDVEAGEKAGCRTVLVDY